MRLIFTFLIILTFVLTAVSQSGVQPGYKSPSSAIPTQNNRSFSVTKVYPNPVKDQLTVVFQSERDGDVQISLINILGSEIKKWEPVAIASGERKLVLDLNSVKTGVYVLKMVKSDQVISQIVKKI